MMIFRNSDWEPLVDALRAELEEYGALFNHLTRQQEEIFARQVDTVLEINGEIEGQIANHCLRPGTSRGHHVRSLARPGRPGQSHAG